MHGAGMAASSTMVVDTWPSLSMWSTSSSTSCAIGIGICCSTTCDRRESTVPSMVCATGAVTDTSTCRVAGTSMNDTTLHKLAILFMVKFRVALKNGMHFASYLSSEESLSPTVLSATQESHDIWTCDYTMRSILSFGSGHVMSKKQRRCPKTICLKQNSLVKETREDIQLTPSSMDEILS